MLTELAQSSVCVLNLFPSFHLHLTIVEVNIIFFLDYFISFLVDLPADAVASLWPILTAKVYKTHLLEHIPAYLFSAPKHLPGCQSSLEFKTNPHHNLHPLLPSYIILCGSLPHWAPTTQTSMPFLKCTCRLLPQGL